MNTPKGSRHGANRKTAILVGVLFITGTAAGVLSAIITGPVLGAPDYLARISTNESPMIIGALLVLVMGLALALVPVLLFPLFKHHNEPLALGYVVFRGALETVSCLLWAISFLALVTLSREYMLAGTPGASHFQTLGTLLLAAGTWNGHLGAILFSLGALMVYCLFYQTRLLPRWLSLWGLIGAVLYLAEPLTALAGSELEILYGPLFLQEMVMAVWLIVRGFHPSTMASKPA